MIITRDVKIDENLLVCVINLAVVPSSTYDPSLEFMLPSLPILFSSSTNTQCFEITQNAQQD